MKPRILRTILVFVALISIAACVYSWPSQGAVPTDAEIEHIRKNIRDMEGVVPPPNYEAQHRRDIGAMQLNLRDKLQAQKKRNGRLP